MFSDAISSISCCWRPSSRLIEAATWGSVFARPALKNPLPAAFGLAVFRTTLRAADFFAALTFFATLRAMIPSVLFHAEERHRRNHPRGPAPDRHATIDLRRSDQAARLR